MFISFKQWDQLSPTKRAIAITSILSFVTDTISKSMDIVKEVFKWQKPGGPKGEEEPSKEERDQEDPDKKDPDKETPDEDGGEEDLSVEEASTAESLGESLVDAMESEDGASRLAEVN